MNNVYFKSALMCIDMKTRIIRQNWNNYAVLLDFCKTYYLNAAVKEDMKNTELAIIKICEQLWSELQSDYEFGGGFTIGQHLYYKYKVLRFRKNKSKLQDLFIRASINYIDKMEKLLCSSCRHNMVIVNTDNKQAIKDCPVNISKEIVLAYIGACSYAIDNYGTHQWESLCYNKSINEFADTVNKLYDKEIKMEVL